MPSVETTNISSAVAQTAHPQTNNLVRPTAASPATTSQIALAAQQAKAATGAGANPSGDAVRYTPRWVEGVNAIREDSSERDGESKEDTKNDNQPEGQPGGQPKKKLSMRV